MTFKQVYLLPQELHTPYPIIDEGLQGIWPTSRGSQKSFIYLRVQSGLLIAMHQDLCVLKMCLRYFVLTHSNVHGLTTCEGLQGIWSTSRGSQKSFIYLRVQSGLLITMHQHLCVLKMYLRYFGAHPLKCSWSHNL